MNIKKIFSFILSIIVIITAFPGVSNVYAAQENKVRVIIKNDTITCEEGAAWEGTLIDKWVDIDSNSTMISTIASAVTSEGYTISGVETNYIDMIGGLSAFDGGVMSGWMGTLNDWFTNEGFSAYTVANGTLQAGDEICMMYTCDYGEDIGSNWYNNDTKLKDLVFSAGELTTVFDGNVYKYTLVIPDDVTSVVVTPTAVNKNFMVKTYKNTYSYNVNGSEYKRTAAIDVESGDKIIVGVGNSNWPSMNSSSEESVYEITVKTESDMVEKPSFTAVNFTTTALSNWTTSKYSKDKYEYDLQIKTYSTSTLSFTSATKYDTEQYSAKMFYTDINGSDVVSNINSAKYTYAYNIPFGDSTLYAVIGDKNIISSLTYDDVKKGNVDNKKVSIYTFNINRPTDTSIGLASSGLVLSVDNRNLSTKKYLGYAEGTFFKTNEQSELNTSVDANGNVKYETGIANTSYNYKTFIIDGADKVAFTVKGKTAYVHSRVKVLGGEYEEVSYNTKSNWLDFNGANEITVYIQTVSDTEYIQNGFENVEQVGNTYKVIVEKLNLDPNNGVITSLDVLSNTTFDLYPEFSENARDFNVVIGTNDAFPVVEFNVSDGATVMLGNNVLEQNENGNYSLTLSTSSQKVTVKGTEGLVNEYTFKSIKKVANGADKVVDYLCIGSQYTNSAGYGLYPETTLSGSLKSLGNFGGYITYYFEEAICDDPNNMYGVDFYAYGNAFASGGSAAENGQVWVSEDGQNWYALAGSEHYEDTTLKDYTITYTKLPNGKVSWVDNYGNSNDGSKNVGSYPDAAKYYLNNLCSGESITLKGILIPCVDGTVMGDSSTSSFAGKVSFGYVDYYANGTVGRNVNPYITGTTSNGFDLAWAVDENGDKVEFANGIHYVKIVTASNIWAGVFNEKSTEVSRVIRTTKLEDEVGKTEKPDSIKVAGITASSFIVLEEGKFEYEVLVDDSSVFDVSVIGANENDNIYINNSRVTSEEVVSIPSAEGDRKVRVIIQNGEKEPLVYILTLKSKTKNETNDIYRETINAILNGSAPGVSSVNGEWVVIGLARANMISEEFKNTYIENVKEYVTSIASNKLHKTKSTDNSRVIMALAALGENPKDVAGYNLLQPLSDFSYVKKQGLNGPIFALISLDTCKYDIEEVCDEDEITDITTRQKLIDYILDKQLADGGFALFGSKGDVDITAMALQALAPYYDDEIVKNAIDNAVEFLSASQKADGNFTSWGSSNSESNSQTIIALSALGIDVRTDERFIKNGTSALTALYYFYNGNGQFKHVLNGKANAMATEQALLALDAYIRMIDGKTSLYDMTDVLNNQQVDNDDENNSDEEGNQDKPLEDDNQNDPGKEDEQEKPSEDDSQSDPGKEDEQVKPSEDNNQSVPDEEDNQIITSDNNQTGTIIEDNENPLEDGYGVGDVRTADNTNVIFAIFIFAVSAAMFFVTIRKKEKASK